MEVTSEDMRRAAADMNRAADRMREVVNVLDEILERHGRHLEAQMNRFHDDVELFEGAVAHMN